MRNWSQPIGWTLTVALVVVSAASCAMGEEMTAAQKACCIAMGHDCGHGPAAQQEDCCSHDSRAVEKFVGAKRLSVAAPAPTVTAVIVFLAVPQVHRDSPLRHHTPSVAASPPIPAYLLLSALLI